MRAGAAPARADRFLIVTADDFGLHPSVNAAVARAARDGILTAASLMVAAPAAAEAVELARSLPALEVGLHLVLADGPALLPAAEIPDLVDGQGRFGNDMARAGLRFFARPRVRRQLEAEVRAQFAAFDRTGLPLGHVNAHKHFHLHPTILGLMLEHARARGAPGIRIPHEPAWAAPPGRSRRGARLANTLLAPWITALRRRVRATGLPCNDRVLGLARSGHMDEGALLELLGRLPTGVTELYLHPAAAGHAPLTPNMSDYAHDAELAALLSPRVRAAVAASGARCGGYRDLASR